jgi:hypothetical protein
MRPIQVAFFWQYLQKTISITSILWLGKSWPTIISCLVVIRGCWLACLRSLNEWRIRHPLQTRTFIFVFHSCSLLLVEFPELGRYLWGCSASLLTNLHLLTLVHLVEILFNTLLLVHLFSHDPFLLLLFFVFLLFHLISQVPLILFFLQLFHFLCPNTWLHSHSIARLSWCYQITELVSKRSASTTFTEFRHKVIISSIVKVMNVLFSPFRWSVSMFAHCGLLRVDLTGLAEAHSLLLLWAVESAMDFLFRPKYLFSRLLRSCYEACHLLIQIIFTELQ